MDITSDSGLSLSVFTAEPGSREQSALDLLASWSAAPFSAPAHLSRDNDDSSATATSD